MLASHVLKPPLPEMVIFSMKNFMLSKVFTDKDGIKKLFNNLSACVGDNPLAKAIGLSPRTGRQTMVYV